MNPAEIAAALGAAQRSGGWWRCRCPVHGSRGPTLALRDGERGLFVKCFGGCARADILDELRRRGVIGKADGSDARRPEPVTIRTGGGSDVDDAARRTALARRIWNTGREARGSPVARYLAGRGITIEPPASLRWAPALRRPDGSEAPVMVARVDDVAGRLIGVHRTWLARDAAGIWRRRDRASLGPIRGGAVRLAPAAETLLIGEGIETCIAVMQATAMPAWAGLSAGGVEALRLPSIVRNVVILADNDANGRGKQAARTAAAGWLAEGRRVRIAMPPEPGTDFADVLIGRAHARTEGMRNAAA